MQIFNDLFLFQLEERKRKKLQNYHNFISNKRLCIHNLPQKYDDKKLKQLFLKGINDKNAKIVSVISVQYFIFLIFFIYLFYQAKVICNKNANNQLGNSKGFGFVEFNEHTFALKALRYLNNNPDIFTTDKRPIVEFSVENKVALNVKKFRQLKQQKLRLQSTEQ